MTKAKLNKEIALHLGMILLVLSAYLYPYFNINTMPARGDPEEIPGVHSTDLMALLAIYPFEIRKTIDEYGQFPFWSPYRMSGTPLFAKPQAVFFYINLPIILFAPTIFAGIKWSILLHFAIAAGAMYLFMFYLTRSSMASLASSFAYAFNGYMISRLNWGQTNIIYPYAWIPLIFLFTFLALEKKEWILNSIFVGIFFALMVLGGGAQIFLYLSAIYAYFLLLYYLINFSKSGIMGNLIKIARMSAVILAVFFGLTAVFILPNSELMKLSVRSQGYSYEQGLGSPLEFNFNSIKTLLISPHIFKKPQQEWNSSGLGLIPFIILLFSFFHWRKKKFILFLSLAIVTLLILSGSFLYYIFWKFIPQFQQVKGIFKGFALIFFPLSVLVGYGFLQLANYTKNFSRPARNLMLYSLVFLVAVNLTVFNNKLGMMVNPELEFSKNKVMGHIANDKEISRYRNFETNGIDWGTDSYDVLLELHDVYGTENVWVVDYLPIFLSYANQFPARGYGILNTKYITSTKELNVSGYRLIGKFEECGFYENGADICQPKKVDGPYLYLNEEYLPRAFFAGKSIFIIGNKDATLQAGYVIMAHELYEPSHTTVIYGEGNVNKYDGSFLNNFNAIILVQGSIDPASLSKLKNYIALGGILLPNVADGKNTITSEDLNMMFSKINSGSKGKADAAKISYYSPNRIVVDTEGKKGFLVMSEKFSLFPGWQADDANGNSKHIYRADGVISAVLLDGTEKQVVFSYKAPLFFRGAMISAITMLLILSYFAYCIINRCKRKNQDKNDSGQPNYDNI